MFTLNFVEKCEQKGKKTFRNRVHSLSLIFSILVLAFISNGDNEYNKIAIGYE